MSIDKAERGTKVQSHRRIDVAIASIVKACLPVVNSGDWQPLGAAFLASNSTSDRTELIFIVL